MMVGLSYPCQAAAAVEQLVAVVFDTRHADYSDSSHKDWPARRRHDDHGLSLTPDVPKRHSSQQRLFCIAQTRGSQRLSALARTNEALDSAAQIPLDRRPYLASLGGPEPATGGGGSAGSSKPFTDADLPTLKMCRQKTGADGFSLVIIRARWAAGCMLRCCSPLPCMHKACQAAALQQHRDVAVQLDIGKPHAVAADPRCPRAFRLLAGSRIRFSPVLISAGSVCQNSMCTLCRCSRRCQAACTNCHARVSIRPAGRGTGAPCSADLQAGALPPTRTSSSCWAARASRGPAAATSLLRRSSTAAA